jgi:hypothetical protein
VNSRDLKRSGRLAGASARSSGELASGARSLPRNPAVRPRHGLRDDRLTPARPDRLSGCRSRAPSARRARLNACRLPSAVPQPSLARVHQRHAKTARLASMAASTLQSPVVALAPRASRSSVGRSIRSGRRRFRRCRAIAVKSPTLRTQSYEPGQPSAVRYVASTVIPGPPPGTSPSVAIAAAYSQSTSG